MQHDSQPTLVLKHLTQTTAQSFVFFITHVLVGTDMTLGNGLHQDYFCTAFDLQPVMSHRFTKSAAGESLKEMNTTEVSLTMFKMALPWKTFPGVACVWLSDLYKGYQSSV